MDEFGAEVDTWPQGLWSPGRPMPGYDVKAATKCSGPRFRRWPSWADQRRSARSEELSVTCPSACPQVDYGRLAVEVRDDEPAEQAGVGAAGADDLDGGLRLLGHLGQAVELASHDLAAADGAVQDALVEDAPELGRTRSVQNCLAGQTRGYLLLEVVQVAVGAGGQDRASVLFGLEQAGDDERLVPAQDRGLGFDARPTAGTSRTAAACGPSSGGPTGGSARRGCPARGPRPGGAGSPRAGGRSPVSILLITSCETVALAARSCWDRPARVR